MGIITSLCTRPPAPAGILSTGYGFSANPDPAAAVKEAVSAAGVAGATFGFISCTVNYDVVAVTTAFAAALPGVALHGVTSCGNILKAGEASPGVACLLFNAPGGFETAYASDAAAACAALKTFSASPAAIIMGTTPGAEEAGLEAIGRAFPGVPVFGGTAADNELDGSWRVLTAEGAKEGGYSLVAVGVKMGASMLGPYSPTRRQATVTKAEGRKVFELDGKPALAWVAAWLGSAVSKQVQEGGLVLPATADKPICTKRGGQYIPAHLAALCPSDQSVDFFAPMAAGDELVVMDAGDGPRTGYAKCLAAAYDEAMAWGSIAKPKAGVLLYCGGMSIAVGDALGKGLSSAAFSDRVRGLPLLGMTVFGEQAAMEGCGNVQRNLSMGMLLFE